MNSDNFESLNYTVTNIGFVFKKTKVLHQWIFIYKNAFHHIELYDSKFSAFKEVRMDDHIIFNKQKMKDQLALNYTIDDLDISLIQIGDEYDLRLNSCSFIHLLEINKNRKYFELKENTSNVMYNKPSNIYNKQVNNALPLSDFMNNNKEEDQHPSLFNFIIQSTKRSELKQRLM